MGEIKLNRRRIKKSPIGDMRDPISFYSRSIEPPKFGESQFSQGHILIGSGGKFCAIISASSQKLFGGAVDLSENVTHQFYSRYDESYFSADIAKYNGLSYKIHNIDDPEKRGQQMVFHCELLGDQSKQVNR